MAGWTSSNEIKVEKVEEILDKNPDLYKQRTIAALNEGRFRDALKEAQIALKYGNNAWEYHVLILRVLFEMKQYSVCMQYINKSGLWIHKHDNSLLQDEQNFIYYVYGVCYRECGYSLKEADVIIITPDGRGMYKNIQMAIKDMNNNKTIFLTNGEYRGSIYIKNRTVQFKAIDKGEVILTNCELKINNSNVEVNNITIEEGTCNEKYCININNSKVTVVNLKISGNKNRSGIYLCNNSKVTIKDSFFSGLDTCVIKEVNRGILKIEDSIFTNSNMGIVATDITTIQGCEVRNMTDSGIVPIITKGEEITVFNSNIHDSKLGLKIIGATVECTECVISNNMHNVAFIDSGIFMGNNTDIIGGKRSAFLESRDIKKVKKEDSYVAFVELDDCRIMRNYKEWESERGGLTIYRKECNVIRRDNDAVGSTIEGVKGTLNSIGKTAWGDNYTPASAAKDTIEELGEIASNFLGKLFK